MVSRRIYIAGPIAGIEDGNRAAFAKRAEKLKLARFEPVNPWDIPPDHPADVSCAGRLVDHSQTHRYGCFLREDIKVLMTCDGFTLLPGWQDSIGASTEEHVARSMGLPLIVFDEE
jgi:hypothetical protein